MYQNNGEGDLLPRFRDFDSLGNTDQITIITMPKIDDITIRRVHERCDIVDVISKAGITLTRRGSDFIALCPFHQEKTGSFHVSPSRNTYHCFGCGAHGDGISFLMEYENKTYPEAITELAHMYGIQVTHVEKEESEEEQQIARQRESMRLALAEVQKYFEDELQADTPDAKKAREYAYNRWGKDYCLQLGIGYAPNSWDMLVRYATDHYLNNSALMDAGVIRLSEQTRKPYSFFRDRVTIPIRDRYGRIIGFTARYIGTNPNEAKYINSTDSLIFKKGDTVFGLNTALRHASKSGRFIIVEGAPDTLRLQSDAIGLPETVAALGTSWTESQFRTLQRYATSLVFLPDADPPKDGKSHGPGIESVMKNGCTAIRLGFNVTVREIPLGADPIMGPATPDDIEQFKLELLEQKKADAKKNKLPKKLIDLLELTDEEIESLPTEKIVGYNYFKQDPDSYINSLSDFNGLNDEYFAIWYGKKLFETANSEAEKAPMIADICAEVLVYIEDKVILQLCLEALAKEFGRLKIWKDALLRAQEDRRSEADKAHRDKLSANEQALRDLGIIVRSGCYWSPGKEGELERWSNFTVEPLYHIIEGNSAVRNFRFKNNKGFVREIELKQEELITPSGFQKKIETQGNFIFKGSISQLQNLKEYLYAITVSAEEITKLGWNSSGEFYAFGDGVVHDNVLYPVDKLGMVQLGDRSYYLPAFAQMHIEEKDSYQFERSFQCRQHGEITLYDFVDKLIAVFGDNAKVGFAFLLATLFLDVVKQTSKRLALLNIFGRKGTGKTELGTALMSFFIRLNDPPSLATTSVSSLNDMLSCAENNLVHLDEYKNDLDFRKIEQLKQIWGGSGQTKKNMDGDKKVQRTYVRSGVILSGQDAPLRDDALFSRVIHLVYSEATFSKEAKERFAEFQGICSRGVAHLTIQLLKLRKLFETDYSAHYNVVKREMMAALAGDSEIVEDRILNNWLAPLAAFHTVQTSLKLPFDYTDLFRVCLGGLRHQNSMVYKTSDVAVFWKMVDSAHMQGRMVKKAHFAIRSVTGFRSGKTDIDFGRKKLIIYLNFDVVAATLGQRVNGNLVVGRLDATTLESYLRTHGAFIGSAQYRFHCLLPNGLPDYKYEMVNGKQVRRVKEVRPTALVFDYELLKEKYEISLDSVQRAEFELTGDEDTDDDIIQEAKEEQSSSGYESLSQTSMSGDEETSDDMPF